MGVDKKMMSMQFVVHHDNPIFENRIRYVFDFIQNHPLAGGNISFIFDGDGNGFPVINFTKTAPTIQQSCLHIPAQWVVFSKSVDLKALVANHYDFAQQLKVASVEHTPSNTAKAFFAEGRFGFDLIETIFLHISRLEEYICPADQKDVHGRMLANAQFLVRHNLEKTPVVDHIVYCFLSVLLREFRSDFKLPQELKTSYRLTFDVDILEKYARLPPFRSFAKYLLKKPSLAALSKLFSNYSATQLGKAKDPYLNFDWMLRPDFKGEQIIYFLVGGASKFDKPFPSVNKTYIEVLGLAKEKGLEVGIHPSYLCMDSLEKMGEEKVRLENLVEKKIKHSRQHFLHFSFEKTPAILESLGIEEDSSLGFSDRIGFRCGTGFTYHLYNFSQEKPHRLKETPMVLMDLALIREAENKGTTPLQLWNDFLSENRHLTQLTFNFHNSRFFDAELDGIDLKALYNSIFDHHNLPTS